MDNFYKGISQYNEKQLEDLKKGQLSYDEPDIIDIEYLLEFINKLKNKESSKMPVYDFSLFDRLDEDKWITIDKSYNIIILEGLFAFHYKKLRDLFDLKIYMNTPEVLCFERRITRNVNSRVGPRGYTSEEYEKDYYNTFVYPSYKKYIEPLKKYADVIL